MSYADAARFPCSLYHSTCQCLCEGHNHVSQTTRSGDTPSSSCSPGNLKEYKINFHGLHGATHKSPYCREWEVLLKTCGHNETSTVLMSFQFPLDSEFGITNAINFGKRERAPKHQLHASEYILQHTIHPEMYGGTMSLLVWQKPQLSLSYSKKYQKSPRDIFKTIMRKKNGAGLMVKDGAGRVSAQQ